MKLFFLTIFMSVFVTGEALATTPAQLNNLLVDSNGMYINREGKVVFAEGTQVEWNLDTLEDGSSVYTHIPQDKDSSDASRNRVIIQYNNNSSNRNVVRLAQVRDTKRVSDHFYSHQEMFTVSVDRSGQVESYTKCAMHAQQDFENANEDKKGLFEQIFSMSGLATDDVRLWPVCYTVSSTMCTGLKNQFETDSLDEIMSEHKQCSDFVKKVKDGLSEDFWNTEGHAENDINYLLESFTDLDKETYSNMEPQHVINEMYNSLHRGGRDEARLSMARLGEMLSRCEELEFQSESVLESGTSQNSATPTAVGSSR